MTYISSILGYLDKCALSRKDAKKPFKCYGCDALDVGCFVQENYAFLLHLSTLGVKDFSAAYLKWQNVDHFYPQFWNCGFHAYAKLYKYFLYSKEESFGRNMRNAFLSVGFNASYVDTGWGANMTEPFLSGRQSSSYGKIAPSFVKDQLTGRPELMQVILRTYWIDYMRLPALEVPEWVRTICLQYATSCQDFLTLNLSL